MANIQIVNKIAAGNQQNNWNQSNGHNVFTLRDLDLDMPKFILIVYKYVEGALNEEIGRMTKSPNNNGYAHFDLQGLLRGNLGFEVEEPSKLGTADESSIQIFLAAGYLDNSTQGYTLTDYSPFGLEQEFYLVTNGRKDKDQLTWNWEDYAPVMYQDAGLAPGLFNYYTVEPVIPAPPEQLGKPLSDYNEAISYGTSCVSGATSFRNFNIGENEDFTLSFINRAYFGSYDDDVCVGTVGIRTWWFEFVSADELTKQVVAIDNTTGNGGGPWPTYATAQGAYINEKYNISRIQCGNSNPTLTTLWDSVYDGTYSHVYICGTSQNYPQLDTPAFISIPPTCVTDSGMEGHWNTDQTDIITETVKLTYVPAECNDFDHVQVKWKNSFGVDDYFTFTKRDDEFIDIDRTTYNKTNEAWTGNVFTVDLNDRGKTNITNRFRYTGNLRTKYLSDAENEYLKNLLMSTEVQANIDGEWKPIVVTNARWTKRTFRTDRLFQLELSYELASPAIPQIG